MVTVLREGGLRIVIYRDDHEPPHVHVYGDGETKIVLGTTPDQITAVYVADNKRGERRRAERIVRANYRWLVEQWDRLHGRDQ